MCIFQVYDAIHESSLHSRLQEWGVNTVVISGWDTNVCCDSTARAAFFRDYRVVFLSDGTGTPNGLAAHQATLTNMDSILADTMRCQQLRAALNSTLLSRK